MVLPPSVKMNTPSHEEWDPFLNADWKRETPSPQCSFRIKRDLMAIYNEPPYGLFVVPDDTDMTVVHALITGAFDTPYEGGFFYFILRCPPDYPLRPPRVKLMTTGAGQVRFNPNLYKCGKVCLSILGTWSGPCWSPAQSLCSVLISIQSVLNEKPYHNEPGFEQEKLPGDVERYNEIIQHETLRVAVVGMLENECGLTIPATLHQIMQKTFLQLYEFYENVALKKMSLTGSLMQDPFSERRGRFQYKTILSRLRALRAKLDSENVLCTPSEQSSDTSSPGSDLDIDDDSNSNSPSNSTKTSCTASANEKAKGEPQASSSGVHSKETTKPSEPKEPGDSND